jgi:hypothetical protein
MTWVGEDGASREPGVDRHDWRSVWASIEDDLASDPDAGLSQLADLTERMLVANGYRVGDVVAASGGEPEIVVTYRAARETAERAELGDASRGDVEQAIDDLRTIAEDVLGETGLA